jgi:DNA-binding transcriptional LysR family regulator
LPGSAAIRREVTYFRDADDGSEESFSVARPQGLLITSHSGMACEAALAGLGVCGVPTFVAEEALRQGRLERVLPDWRLRKVQLNAAMPTRKHVPARTRAFIDFLVQTFGGTDRDPWLHAPVPGPSSIAPGKAGHLAVQG